MHDCPNCGFTINDMNKEICPNCNFDFNSTISCGYKISNKCVHTQKECNINGMDYELCNIYLHKSGISK